MSYKATGWAYELPLKGPAKPVLVALADFADEAGSCYPGQDRICTMTGLSLRSVQRALDRLERMGLLTREHRYDRRGYRTSDRYVLSLDTQVLPVTEPSSQSAFMSDGRDLHVTVTPPTRHSDGVTISGSSIDPSGGGEGAPTPTPEPGDNSTATAAQKLGDGELVPYCKRHAKDKGHDRACTACKLARLAWEQALAAADQEQQWVPVTPKRSKHWRPGLCEEHLQPEATCDACAQDRKRVTA